MIKLIKGRLLFSSLFSKDKSLFGSIENQNGNPFSSFNIVSIPYNIDAQTNYPGYFFIGFCLMIVFSCDSNLFWKDIERSEISISRIAAV